MSKKNQKTAKQVKLNWNEFQKEIKLFNRLIDCLMVNLLVFGALMFVRTHLWE